MIYFSFVLKLNINETETVNPLFGMDFIIQEFHFVVEEMYAQLLLAGQLYTCSLSVLPLFLCGYLSFILGASCWVVPWKTLKMLQCLPAMDWLWQLNKE